MRAFCVASLFGFAVLAIPHSATAVQVDITYTINGGSNTSALLGGAVPSGGTATVRWSLTSLSGAFINSGPATLINLTITAPSSLVVPSFSGAQVLQGATTATFSQSSVGPSLTFLTALVSGLGNGSTFYFYGITAVDASLLATGSETSRVLVPEPGPDALVLLAVAGLAAGRTAWRRKPLRSS